MQYNSNTNIIHANEIIFICIYFIIQSGPKVGIQYVVYSSASSVYLHLAHSVLYTIYKKILPACILLIYCYTQCGPGQLSHYSHSLWAGWCENRIPVEARFSAIVQAGPGAHPASYIMGTGSFPGVKRPGRGVDHPPHLAPRLKKEYFYTSTLPLVLRGLL